MINFYKKNKKIVSLAVILLLITSAFVIVPTCSAMEPDEIAIIVIGILAQLIVKVCGWFIGIIIKAIVLLGSYNKFIDEYAIIEAWKIIRDFCNMFFILILLIISFATILRVESYNMKKWLPKLIIMAVLINFSRMICGLLIDISQVVFLTFISTLSANGSDFVTLAKVDDTLKAVESAAKGGNDSAFFKSVASILAAIIFLVIATIVLLAILIVIIMRVVMFWIYVVLSPLAFLLSSFPGGQKYASQYWGEFTKYLVNGPVLAFFIWLSLVATNGAKGIDKMQFVDTSKNMMDMNEATQIFTTASFMSYVMGIGMLVGGLIVSAQVGGIGGSFGRNMLGKVQGKTSGLLKAGAFGAGMWGASKAWGGTKAVGRVGLAGVSTIDRWAGKGIDWGADQIGRKTNLGGEGIVKKSAQGVWNSPKNFADWASGGLKKKLNMDASLDKARHSVYGEKADDTDGAEMKYNDMSWRKMSNGHFAQLDNEGKVKRDTSGNATYLEKDNKRVGDMSALGASFHQAWNSAQSGANATKNKAEKEAIGEWQKKIGDSGMSDTDMLRQLKDSSISKDKKMALAMTLAIKKGFKDGGDIKAARKAVGSNHLLSSELNTEIDKNQAHIAYDLKSSPADQEKFKNRIDSGKIDPTKLDSDAYKDEHVMKHLQKHSGKNFKKIMETAYKRGDKYEKSIEKGILERRDASTGDDKYAMAKLHARLSGNTHESFKDSASNGIDLASMEKYLSTAKAGDINKISVKNIDEMIKMHGDSVPAANRATAITDAEKSIVKAMNFANLKKIHKQGDNSALVAKVKKLIETHGTADEKKKIALDSELSSV
jgi:hypothetical protein